MVPNILFWVGSGEKIWWENQVHIFLSIVTELPFSVIIIPLGTGILVDTAEIEAEKTLFL